MVQLSRRKLHSEVYEEMFHILLHTLNTTSAAHNMQSVIQLVFSGTERIMVAKRITILYLLQKGVAYRDIAKILCVSEATVHKFARIRDDNRQDTETMLFAVLADNALSAMFETLFEDFFASGLPHSNWHGSESRKRKNARKKRFGI